VRIIMLLLTFYILIGCSKVNDDGFYVEGKNKDLHKNTKTLYDENGFNIEGYNRNGFNLDKIHFFTKTKYNQSGYDNEGFDISGYDKRGFNHKHIHKSTKTKYDENLKDYKGIELSTDFKIGYYTDKWGDRTGKQYIQQSNIKGWYNDDYKHRSDAKLTIRIHEYGFVFRLSKSEYSKSRTGSFPTLSIRTDKNKKYEFGLWGDDQAGDWLNLPKGDAILDYKGGDAKGLLIVLTEGNKVEMIFEIKDNTMYHFELDTVGLNELSKKTKLQF